LNCELKGKFIDEIHDYLLKRLLSETSGIAFLLRQALEIIQSSLLEEEDKLYLEGASHMIEQPEFTDVEKLKALLKVFEEKEVILDVIRKSLEDEGIQIHIGKEIGCELIQDCSMVFSNYKIADEPMGALGIIGPRRMEYSRAIAVVEYVSGRLSKFLTDLQEKYF
jgi:heat-inducible transcriptional repressor